MITQREDLIRCILKLKCLDLSEFDNLSRDDLEKLKLSIYDQKSLIKKRKCLEKECEYTKLSEKAKEQYAVFVIKIKIKMKNSKKNNCPNVSVLTLEQLISIEQIDKSEKKSIKNNLIIEINHKIPSLSIPTLTKWSINKLKSRSRTLDSYYIVKELSKYGDTISTPCMNYRILYERLMFVRKYGTRKNRIKRGNFISYLFKYDHSNFRYRKLLSMKLSELENLSKIRKEKNERDEIVTFLVNNGHTDEKLKKMKTYKLRTLKLEIKNRRGTRKELIDIMMKHDSWNLNSLESWGIPRMKNTYKKLIFQKYDPINNKESYTQYEMAIDMCDMLWVDLVF